MRTSVVGRLGVTASVVDGALELELAPRPETMRHGMVRASVIAFVVDAVAGIAVDVDPEVWTLTSDMSVRMRPTPAPPAVRARSTLMRRGRRSVTAAVELVTDVGAPMASGVLGFVTVPRRPTDPPKPPVTPDVSARLFSGREGLGRPLPEEAGLVVVDAAAGVVEVEVTPELRNPAGTLQGAMVALVAEVAAEELLSARFGVPFVVTDLDLRYLSQAPIGPVRSEARLLGDSPDAPVEVVLSDLSAGRVTTHVYARALALRSTP